MTVDSVFQNSALVSELVNGQQLDYALRVCRHRLTQQGLSSGHEIPDRLLADILIEQEVLTDYQADQLLTGRTKFYLGPYLITDWIGQGGMGQVFKGTHQLMGRECAVKVLPLARATQEARDSFAREIRMQANLDCPYLVRAFDAGQDGSVHYLVTEYVPGMDLRRLVKSSGALSIQQAAKIIMQAALGLDYAHDKGLVHRDVKPGNILVAPNGEAKVSDVGLAGFAKDLVNDPRAGKIVGTTDYLSPEQIRTPLEIKPASDIYSLGCTLYYAVCGKVPFPGGDTESKLRRHLEAFPLHPRNFAPDITEDFVDIIVDMMEKDVTKRIANAAEVAARLEPWAVEAMVASVSMRKSPWLAPPPPSDGNVQQELHGESPHDAQGSSQFSSFSGSAPARPRLGQSDTEVPYGSETAVDQSTSHFVANQSETSANVPPSDGPVASLAQGQFPSIETDERPIASVLGSGSESFLGSRPSESRQTSSLALRTKLNRDQPSVGMVVAVTAAILIPPALLVGAIIGYVIAQ